jgi:hypothetical protein
MCKWVVSEPDSRMAVAELLAPFLLRPRDPSALYVAQDQPALVVAEILRLSDRVAAPKTTIEFCEK